MSGLSLRQAASDGACPAGGGSVTVAGARRGVRPGNVTRRRRAAAAPGPIRRIMTSRPSVHRDDPWAANRDRGRRRPARRRWPPRRGIRGAAASANARRLPLLQGSLPVWPRHCPEPLMIPALAAALRLNSSRRRRDSGQAWSALCDAKLSHFNPSFGNVKAFNLKKLKLTLIPSPQWPQAALRLGGDGRQVPKAGPGPSLERNPSNPFQKPLEVQKKLALGLSEEAQCSLGANSSNGF